jgi:hypothetical protein
MERGQIDEARQLLADIDRAAEGMDNVPRGKGMRIRSAAYMLYFRTVVQVNPETPAALLLDEWMAAGLPLIPAVWGALLKVALRYARAAHGCIVLLSWSLGMHVPYIPVACRCTAQERQRGQPFGADPADVRRERLLCVPKRRCPDARASCGRRARGHGRQVSWYVVSADFSGACPGWDGTPAVVCLVRTYCRLQSG